MGNSELFIGIDPGMSGGVAMIYGEKYTAIPMPGTRLQLHTLIKLWADSYGTSGKIACVEKVASRPGQGVASTFKFGKGYGEVLGIVTALGFRIIEPTPQAWKKVMLAGTDKSKDASIQMAENLFPNIELVQPGCRKPHDGAAEALLLAEYGRTL